LSKTQASRLRQTMISSPTEEEGESSLHRMTQKDLKKLKETHYEGKSF
jgi:hypothetical protein